MSDRGDCRTMALWCAQRAKEDHKNSAKWLARAERWRDLARAENAWRLQKKPGQQVMHAGPMATQPDGSGNPARQQG
jgi:hypothetical protein